MANQTKLGKLLGTPAKDTVPVVYKGHRYNASEEDVRYIQVLVSKKYFETDYNSTEVTKLVEDELGIIVYNQQNEQMMFLRSGMFDTDYGPMFNSGFFDVNVRLSSTVIRANRKLIMDKNK